MFNWNSPLAKSVLAGAAAVATAVAVAPAAAAAGTNYVALGDSYSSGVGTRSYLNDGTDCYRSTQSYPALIAAAKGLTLNLRACSGATTADVANSQLSALSSATTYVTISAGGNDVGFASVLTECAKPGWMSNCQGKIAQARSIVAGELPGRLNSLYSSIRSRAPYAKVVVVGYPRIFGGEDCNALTWFSASERRSLNEAADYLNSVTAERAAAAGFTFTNPTSRFVGHAVCDQTEWINGLSWPIVESYHANSAGHRDGYTPLVSPSLVGSTVAINAATVRRAQSSAEALIQRAADARSYDAKIRPELFVKPNLNTAAAKLAAARAGVDLRNKASIDKADALVSAAQERAATVAARLGETAEQTANRVAAATKSAVASSKSLAGKTLAKVSGFFSW